MRYVIVLLLAGCSTMKLVDIDYSIQPPRDWPKLEERITYGTVEEVHRWCNMPEFRKANTFNCARIYFGRRVCQMYLSDRKPETLAHEQAHCRGYDHVGEGYRSHQAWESFKRTGRAQ